MIKEFPHSKENVPLDICCQSGLLPTCESTRNICLLFVEMLCIHTVKLHNNTYCDNTNLGNT